VADASFDVVSKVDHQEVDNAVNQTAKELRQRFDFRGTGAAIDWSGKEMVIIAAETESRAVAAL
jgi:cyclic-di-GMP-binding protein